MHDVNADQVFDYTRRRGVQHTEIVLPTAAAKVDINWARDRQALWNAAESAEKRKDARVAREYEVALPYELKQDERVALVQEFAHELADRYGVAVDFAIHKPHRSGDERNHHAHILATTRQVTATGLGAKAQIEWSDTDRRKQGLEPAKVDVRAIRERWAALTNEHLLARGLEARVDHRSLAAQGIEREAQSHLGPAVSGMERRGIATEVGQRIAFELAVAAQARLERAAAMGREQAQIRESILDLSGDLQAARQERERGPRETPEEARQRGRDAWLAMRAKDPDKDLSIAERQQRAAERWAEQRRQQLEPGRKAELEREMEERREREKKFDRGIDDDLEL